MSGLVERLRALSHDFSLALRSYRHSPGFTATAIVALTLGIGANTAVFSIVNAVLLRPVPFPDPDRLVMMMISRDKIPRVAASSRAQFVHYEARSDVLEDVAAFRSISLSYADAETPAPISASQVSEAYFRAFRARFARGRGFSPEEDRPGAGRVAVISRGFWEQRLGADPNIVGANISLSGDSYTVVGVVDADFDVRELGAPQAWVPLKVDPNTTDRGYILQVVARLKPGVTLAQAQDRLEASVPAYLERFPREFGPRGGFSALPLREALVGPGVRPSLFILVGAVTFVLLIACANVANLLLVRASGRRRELAIRAALGAGRGRIVQQLLAEGVLLALAGGALGLALGFVGMRALLRVDTAGLPRLGDSGSLIGLDWRVVAFTVGVSLVTTILFSLAPAFASCRANPVEAINDSGIRASGGLRQNKTRAALVMAEVAFAVLLLIGAALLIRTSIALNRVDAGFTAENLLTMRTAFTGSSLSKSEDVARLVQSTRERLRAIPGVVDAVATWSGIPTQPGWSLPFNIPGRDNEGLYTGGGAIVFTSPGYFDTLDIPVIRGRAFSGRDDASAPPVAIVNEALARQYWQDGADPFADRLLVGGGAVNMQAYADEPPRQIIGIVGNVRAAGLATDPGPVVYVPQAQLPDAFNQLVVADAPMAWIIRTQGEPGMFSPAIRRELRLATGLPVTDVRTMQEILSLSVSRQSLHTLLMTVFGGAALLLATIGIYGLMAYVVEQRAREIGIRMALGANAGRVRAMLIRQGLWLVGYGLAAGLVAAYYLAALLSSFLFEVQSHDTAVFVAIPVVLTLVALPAVLVPAIRASRVNPVASIKQD
jgi:putative ABC transport system permease protein